MIERARRLRRRSSEGTGLGERRRLAVRIAEAGLVRRFMGVVIRGVKVGPSPAWLVKRLESVGSRSINNVVDASNYVLHELGQPTHAFDLAKLGGATVDRAAARRPASGSRRSTESTARLRDDMIVIADAERPQAIAGVMGGRDSEVTDATTDLFLEVANFNPGRVRTARRALGLSTDASYRFERGVDVEIAPSALERVAQLIMLLAGGSVDGAPVDLSGPSAKPADARASRPPAARRRSARRRRSAATKSKCCFASVGFDVDSRGDHLRVTPPSWRGDVSPKSI